METNPKMMIILDTDDEKVLKEFYKKFYESEIVIIPENIKILIKDKQGNWKEVKNDR